MGLYISGAIGVLLIIVIMTSYRKAPPDKALIISGPRAKPKIAIGRSALKLPFLERADFLTLKLISVDVQTKKEVHTKDFIAMKVDGAVTLRIGTGGSKVDEDGNIIEGAFDDTLIHNAMKHFLNASEEDIMTTCVEVLEGNMREAVGLMTLQEMVQDPKKFAKEVKENVKPELMQMGIELINFTVQNFTDEENVIRSLGEENRSKIRENAAIAKADSDQKIAVAESASKMKSEEARINQETEVAQQENALTIKKAELQKEADKAKAEADAVYEINKQEQRKTLEIATASADIAREEQNVLVNKQKALAREQELSASVVKEAEADKNRREIEAEATLNERRLEAAALRVKAEAEAERIQVVGKAEAEATRLQGLAQAEAIEKKAEAMEKYGQAAMLEMLVGVIPEVSKTIGESIGNIGSITLYGGTQDGSIGGTTELMPVAMAKIFQTIESATGLSMTDLVNSESIQAKTDRNVTVTSDGSFRGVDIDKVLLSLEDTEETQAPDSEVEANRKDSETE